MDEGRVMAPGGVRAITGVPSEFGLQPDAADSVRRRKLASWVTHPENPLFARLMVNRLWHHHFGIGIESSPFIYNDHIYIASRNGYLYCLGGKD